MWYTPNLFLPVVALEFSELKTPLVYTFFPPIGAQWAALKHLHSLLFPALVCARLFGACYLVALCFKTSEKSLSRTSAGIFFVQSRGEFAVTNAW